MYALANFRVPFLGPALGFWFLVVHPAYLLYTTSAWRGSSPIERIGYSVAGDLLLLLVGGFTINMVLPSLGIHRPLATVPVVAFGDILNVSLYLVRRRWPDYIDWRRARELCSEEWRVMTIPVFAIAAAVLGANRLNNNAGDQLSIAALVLATITVACMLSWRRKLSDTVIGIAVYLVSLSLLLMNSLRGWYITGHDIQGEYRVFQLTSGADRWSISAFRDAYNACLSITILPTEIARVVHIDDPYIYKVFFQALFALVPMLVYAIARRHWSKLISILATTYFIGFPIFINDMSFEDRQEIAFIFVCAGILAVTNIWWGARRRRLLMLAAAAGLELSHYSTMYLFVGILVLGYGIATIIRFLRWVRQNRSRRSARDPWLTRARTVGLGSLAIVAVMVFLWGWVITGTIQTQLSFAASGVSVAAEAGASNAYSLFSSAPLNDQKVLNEYRQATIKAQAAAAPETYLAEASASQYATPVVQDPQLPVTSLGRLLQAIHVSPTSLNTIVRQGAAKDEQLFVLIGAMTVFFMPAVRRQISREFFAIAFASLVIVGVFAVLPDLAADYGAERSFLFSLILTAPMLVVGSAQIFTFFGQRWKILGATFIGLVIFVSTTGLMPQLTGGYASQLTLNANSQYSDTFYVRQQDVAASAWLSHYPQVITRYGYDVNAPFLAERFAFTSPKATPYLQDISDIYPTVVLTYGWTILDYSITHHDTATAFVGVAEIDYKYPVGLLATTKDLVYNNGTDEIYK